MLSVAFLTRCAALIRREQEQCVADVGIGARGQGKESAYRKATTRRHCYFCSLHSICVLTLNLDTAVIMNEHLIEALRRLRKTSSETNVDRRLVTNVLLYFLTTPRADPKRFEMLGLLGTVLGWGDTEREKAGLIRSSGAASGAGVAVPSSSGGGGLFWGRGVKGTTSPSKSKNLELEKTDETEVCDVFISVLFLFLFLLNRVIRASRFPVCGSSSSLRRPARVRPEAEVRVSRYLDWRRRRPS